MLLVLKLQCLQHCTQVELIRIILMEGITVYRISGFFRVGLIFAEFATSLKSPKIDTAKNKPYYKSSLRVLEIAKIGLSENLTHLQSVIFRQIFPTRKIPDIRYVHPPKCRVTFGSGGLKLFDKNPVPTIGFSERRFQTFTEKLIGKRHHPQNKTFIRGASPGVSDNDTYNYCWTCYQ